MRTFTVKGLSDALGNLIARSFPRVQVEGEIAQVQTPASGHCFFTLREADARIGAVVWRSTYQGLRHKPRPGDRVVCSGKVALYAPQGRLQLYVNTLRPVGDGELARHIEAIKGRLDADGLLDPRRRRPLPRFPRVIGVVTSLTGAALQDFLRVSQRRWPARILVAGATVQGAEAASSMVRALELLFEDGRAEVVVVTRGGGSKLDLMPFHDETLCRWIATAPVPVVSAVGHEIDTSITDLVADASAPTPSAAALTVLPDAEELGRRATQAEAALRRAMQRRLARDRQRVEGLQRRLRHPSERLKAGQARQEELRRRLDAAMKRQLAVHRRRVEAAERGLRALSPLGVLDRGYALVSRADGALVRDARAVAEGDALVVRVARGALHVTAGRPVVDSAEEAT